MRHCQLIASRVDIVPLMHAIMLAPDLWNANKLRTEHPGTAHAEVDDIWLWFNPTDDESAVPNDKEVIPYPAWSRLPQARPLVYDLMHRVGGVRLGRVIVTRLPPGKKIDGHVDGGAPADYYTRFQIALQCLPGCILTVADETVQFHTGECWYFDNTKPHSVANNSADDRIVMIVDIRVP